jgi:hypothetical protein
VGGSASFAIIIQYKWTPLLASHFITDDIGNRFIFCSSSFKRVLHRSSCGHENCSSKANPGIFLPMALAITFPFNITFGMLFIFPWSYVLKMQGHLKDNSSPKVQGCFYNTRNSLFSIQVCFSVNENSEPIPIRSPRIFFFMSFYMLDNANPNPEPPSERDPLLLTR